MFAALGEMVSERAGVLNIGLEGMMLVGAYVGFVAAYHSGSTRLGFLAGAGGGAAVRVIMVVLCVWLGLDQIVVGIAITLVGEGATALIFDSQFAESRPTLGETGRVSIPLLSDIPVVGGHDSSDGSVFSQPAIVYIGLILIVVVAWMMRRTHLGLNVRAAGDTPAALDAAGVSVLATRSWAVLFAGAMAGVGGAFLSVTAAGLFEDFITGGRGFIAIVLAMLARGKALWVLIGSFIFGISLSLSDALQIAGIDISTDVVFMLPFVAVIVVLVDLRPPVLPAAGARAALRARGPLVRIETGFDIARDPADTYALLLDLERVMPCFPGAELLARRPDGARDLRVTRAPGTDAAVLPGRRPHRGARRPGPPRRPGRERAGDPRRGVGERAHRHACRGERARRPSRRRGGRGPHRPRRADGAWDRRGRRDPAGGRDGGLPRSGSRRRRPGGRRPARAARGRSPDARRRARPAGDPRTLLALAAALTLIALLVMGIRRRRRDA